MNVVHFRTVFSSVTETFVYDTITELQRLGVECCVLTLRRENARERPFDSLRVIQLPSRSDPRRFLRRAYAYVTQGVIGSHLWPFIRKELHAELDRRRPDVLHAHFGIEGAIVAPVARQLEIPLVISHHGFDVSRLPKDPRWQALYDYLWRTAAAVTVVSKRMREMVSGLGCPVEKIFVIHVGKDLQAYPYRPPRMPVRRLVSVGRFEEKKGHIDAVKAVHRVLTEGAPLSLTIVGDGPLRGEVSDYVASHTLEDRICLAGLRPHDATKEILRQSDAFILCSKTASDGDQEGIPTVLMEAQALGLPCVATRHAGIPELIPDENQWLLAEEGNVGSIVERIRALLAAPAATLRAVSVRGRQRVEAEFCLHAESAKLVRLYESVSS